MMIMPNEESEWVHQIVRYIRSPALFTQGDNSDFEAEKNGFWSSKFLGAIEKLICLSGRSVC